MTNAEIARRRAAAVARGLGVASPIAVQRALNAELWDVEGRRYIDFAGGIGVVNTGHRHPHVIAAVRSQLEAFTHASIQVSNYPNYIELAEALNRLAPGPLPKKSLLVTTGAEAIENAVKIARFSTGRPAVIAFSGAFHGRTMFTLALTGKVKPYKLGFGPFPGDVYHVPFPADSRDSVDKSVHALDELFRSDVDPGRVAAIVIEPVQGEGGFNIAPFSFLHRLREIADHYGILLIADEIQAGFGRTGRFFAIEHSGVIPDMIASAKSLAGGFPLAAVTGRADVMDSVPVGGLGGTYSGNPVSCAAALAVIEVIQKEQLLDRSVELGRHMVRRLEAMQRERLHIANVRGLGAMVAFDIVTARGGQPDAPRAASIIASAANRGLIVLACGAYGNVIRILVPLTASNEIIDEGLDILRTALADTDREQQQAESTSMQS
jgi:4-aminobutyrate aminotransferase/(S)-3-amino-2-methylpropionate transaminase